ncbi:MAG TPA: DUF1015 domain-containing protein, partial [Candidatus Thermoplasmatota archaeon]|nr:DUF1015 domain-containing protein [Candidatus Thermoplasmatota archaeon]
MVAIAPFRALRYDGARTDLAAVTTPPHDVISPAEREAFALRPESMAHLILPEPRPGDAEPPAAPNRFLRTRDLLAAWTRERVMERDAKPALYAYEVTHRWGPAGTPLRMRGVFARIRLDPTYREVRRHERTLTGRKRDRLHLREATRCDVEPIWLLYRDERGWVEEVLWSNAYDELLRFTDEAGTEHRLWRIDRPEAIDEVVAQFEERHAVIADGHHRYQTALDHAAATGDLRHGAILACLVRDNDPGLRIQATHRILARLPFGADEALRRAARLWESEPVALRDLESALAGLDPEGRECIVVLQDKSGPALHRLRLRGDAEVR